MKANLRLDILTSLNPRKLIYLFIGIFFLVIILEIWTVNRLSTYGEQINKIEQLSSDLQLQNDILKDDIAKKSSLSVIAQKASQLGFAVSDKPQYILPEGL